MSAMAGYTDPVRSDVADYIVNKIAEESLHSADPGSTGGNELSGGGYARQVPTYDAASAGFADLSSSLTYKVDANSTVAYWGMWDGGGGFIGSRPMETTTTFETDGTFELTSAPVDVNNI